MQNLTFEELENEVKKLFKQKVELFLGESQKEIEDRIYPFVYTRILSKFFPEKKHELFEKLSQKDKQRYKIIEIAAKTSLRDEKQTSKVFDIIFTLTKDIDLFIARIIHHIIYIELKFENREKLEERCESLLYLYSPIVSSMGLHKIKNYIENVSFEFLFPEEKNKIENLLKINYPEIDKNLNDSVKDIKKNMQKPFIKNVLGRIKTPYSIYKKMSVKDSENLNGIFDIMAIRIIVKEINHCYEVLGIIHNLYEPIGGRIKDYIVKPKPNGYQSIHTTILLSNKKPLEIQIRTEEMDKFAEYGQAAHSIYKVDYKLKSKELEHIKDILKISKDKPPIKEWSSLLENEFDSETISVFTPKHDVIELPIGSTALDFAYAIHTNVGDHCMIAKVDGKPIPLNVPLSHGQVVEIITRKDVTPNIFWIDHAITAHAKSQIKKFLKSAKKEAHILNGKNMLNKILDEYGKPKLDNNLSILKTWREKSLSLEDRENLLEQIHNNVINGRKLIQELYPDTVETKLSKKRIIRKKIKNNLNGIIIDNQEGIVSHIAKCCNPKYGDKIIGYSSFKGYISIHKEDCDSIKDLPKDHFIRVKWEIETI